MYLNYAFLHHIVICFIIIYIVCYVIVICLYWLLLTCRIVLIFYNFKPEKTKNISLYKKYKSQVNYIMFCLYIKVNRYTYCWFCANKCTTRKTLLTITWAGFKALYSGLYFFLNSGMYHIRLRKYLDICVNVLKLLIYILYNLALV